MKSREKERYTESVSKECLDAKLPKRGNLEEEHKLMFDDAESERNEDMSFKGFFMAGCEIRILEKQRDLSIYKKIFTL